ncbi:uncharacterized protein M421DRAFT_57832 [Didymella exigua CBS 183.55]|uniref:Zn(2)-C6 fungal-type domain-containing protein n=1 Tax=Didymella exigua CBS 183.55 TaxID=1150837 RepID=A0A6A5RUW5_9PLEO|nr:uncharacterized protein M421DRAFT_57832 [Didymella exigua CBS 183.55]KAF1930758.1 hypothetical protein M421DRAFT_57832 [Didymella exigua CBS 183.55]
MPTRRTHNKTRLGCRQCKRRRIKCDGKHPTCANCDKKGESCSFLQLVPTSWLTGPVSSKGTAISASSSPEVSYIQGLSPDPKGTEIEATETKSSPQTLSPTGSLSSSAPLYLRLNDVWKDIRDPLPPSLQDVLYHYEYTTSLTLATDDPAKAAWQTCVPEMAHAHDFLVNCVLSVASLHLGRIHGDRTQRANMNAVAASRMNKALTTYRPQLENINAANAAALFASSTLTAVYLFRTSALDIEALRETIQYGTVLPPAGVVDKMMDCILRTVWGLRGPLTVLMSGWNHVVNGAMYPVAARNWWPRRRTPATPRAEEEDRRLQDIDKLWRDTDKTCEPQTPHLDQALGYLREAYALVSQLTLPGVFPPMTAVPYAVDDETTGVLTDRGAIFVWSTRISREFIQLLENKDRDALVILAHYAVLPGRVRNVWWLEGLGADFVTAIAMAIGIENWHLIDWPAHVVGVDLWNAFGIRQDRLQGKPDEMHMDVI